MTSSILVACVVSVWMKSATTQSAATQVEHNRAVQVSNERRALDHGEQLFSPGSLQRNSRWSFSMDSRRSSEADLAALSSPEPEAEPAVSSEDGGS
jgi:hypothetical protein